MPTDYYYRTKKVKELLDNPEKFIVRVTIGDKELKRDLYMLEDEVGNIKNLKLADIDNGGNQLEGGRLPKMKLKTHHKKTSEIGKEAEKILMGEHEHEE